MAKIIVVEDPELFKWLQNIEVMGAGHFLSAIAKAVFQADGENQELMYPLLKQLQEKYPQYNSKHHMGQVVLESPDPIAQLLAQLLTAVEFGYKAHEKGQNLQTALRRASTVMVTPAPESGEKE